VRQDPRRDLGGALHFVAAGGDRRFVRAVVDTGTKQFGLSQKRLVLLTSVLGHELQHAAEVAAAESIRNEQEFAAHFRRIGISPLSEALETEHAQAVQIRVTRELEGRDPGPAPCDPAGGHDRRRPS
jgi:hypothetical protein